jgi:hypothetical protein
MRAPIGLEKLLVLELFLFSKRFESCCYDTAIEKQRNSIRMNIVLSADSLWGMESG